MVAVSLLGLGFTGAQESPKSSSATNAVPAASGVNAEEPADFRNWLNVGFGGTFIDGDKAAFTRRWSMRKGAFGGVEDFHWEQDVGKRGLFKVDGHGLFDNHDYSIRLELSQPDKGFIRVGYTEFRTYYDGTGGFFPGNSKSFSLYNEELAMTRGSAFFEAGLRLEDVPEITFRFEHVFRRGQKDSLEWGDTGLTGLAGATAARGIVPSFYDIDESRDIFSLNAKHTLRQTDLGLGLRYEISDQMNSRNMLRLPTQAGKDRYVTQRDGFTADFFNVHAWTETRFSEEVLFTTGYSFTTMNSDLSGSRIYGPGYDPVYDPVFARRQERDHGYLALAGGSQMNQHVVLLNLHLTPWDNWSITPAIRVERQDLDNASSFVDTEVGAGPLFKTTETQFFERSQRGILDVSESVDVRYTGITNWVFYTRANWMQGEGDLTENEVKPITIGSGLLRDTEFRRSTQKYEVGANWYPLRKLNLAVQYYHKLRTEDYTHVIDNVNGTGDRYPAFLRTQKFDTDDVNFRVTSRPWNNLTLVSRYDFQLSGVRMRGDGLNPVQSGEVTSHILSQSISWAPLARLYFQASGSYAYDKTETPATADPAIANLVPNPKNGYWNTSVLVGYALDNKTDVQAQYLFYKASNFMDNSAFSQPYGESSEEQGVTASVTRQLRKGLRLTLKYGFFRNRDQTSGGLNNYDAHMAASTLQYQF